MRLASLVTLWSLSTALWPWNAEAAIVGTYESTIETGSGKISIALRCEAESRCELDSASAEPGASATSAPPTAFTPTVLSDLRELRLALQFARDRRATIASNDEARAIQGALKPLLESKADLTRCVRLAVGGNVCELDSAPWGRPTVVYFGADLSNCRPQSVFCGYVIVPLFQTAKTATMRATTDAFVAARFSLRPVAPEVADYVKSVQDKVQSLLLVPPGTKADTRLIVQVQFNQELGSRYSINIMDRESCDCPAFKTAAVNAVVAAWPIPLLPKEKWQFLEGRNAKLYMIIRASP